MDKNKGDAVFQQVVEIGGFLLMMYLGKKAMSPDFGRMLRMRTLLTVKRFADGQAEAWQAIASKAASGYNKAKV